jgi:hypothetical protein
VVNQRDSIPERIMWHQININVMVQENYIYIYRERERELFWTSKGKDLPLAGDHPSSSTVLQAVTVHYFSASSVPPFQSPSTSLIVSDQAKHEK